MRVGSLALVIGLGTFVLQIVPYLVFGFSKTLPPPLNSVPDLVDIAIYMPFVAVSFYTVYLELVGGSPRLLKWSYMLSYALFFEGHGLHWAANSIDVYTGEAIWVAYMLDEVISHKVMFAGMFLMVALGGLSEFWMESRGRLLPSMVGGVFMGFSASLMYIEGQSAPEFLAASILYVLLTYTIKAIKGRSLRSMPFLTFSITSMGSSAFFMLLYLAVFGSFIQPSQWF